MSKSYLPESPGSADENFKVLHAWQENGLRLGVPRALSEIHAGQQWKDLGFDSFAAACDGLFNGWRPMLSRPERRELVVGLSNQGLSTRAIAAVAGVDQATVVRDQQSRDANASRDEPEPKVTGLDGKAYPRPGPEPPVIAGMSPAVAEYLERDDPGMLARMAWRKAFRKSNNRIFRFFAEWTPEAVARNVAADELDETLSMMERSVIRWVAEVRKAQGMPAGPGLRVVEGGQR